MAKSYNRRTENDNPRVVENVALRMHYAETVFPGFSNVDTGTNSTDAGRPFSTTRPFILFVVCGFKLLLKPRTSTKISPMKQQTWGRLYDARRDILSSARCHSRPLDVGSTRRLPSSFLSSLRLSARWRVGRLSGRLASGDH